MNTQLMKTIYAITLVIAAAVLLIVPKPPQAIHYIFALFCLLISGKIFYERYRKRG